MTRLVHPLVYKLALSQRFALDAKQEVGRVTSESNRSSKPEEGNLARHAHEGCSIHRLPAVTVTRIASGLRQILAPREAPAHSRLLQPYFAPPALGSNATSCVTESSRDNVSQLVSRKHCMRAIVLVAAVLLVTSAAFAAECPASSKQSLSGPMITAHPNNKGGWTMSVLTSTPCNVLRLVGRGPIPRTCAEGEYFNENTRFTATGTVNEAIELEVTSIYCSK